jgi:hypothetical protein
VGRVPALVVVLRGRELLDPPWLLLSPASWIAVVLASAITVPLKYPYEATDDLIDSGVVGALLLPIIVGGRVLREGPAEQVLTRARGLSWWRFAAGTFFVVASAGQSAVASLLMPVNHAQVLLDALVLTSAGLVSAALLGVQFLWLVPVLAVATSSIPGLMPLHLNLLYRLSAQNELAATAAALAVVGVALHMMWGAGGLLGTRRSVADREADYTET